MTMMKTTKKHFDQGRDRSGQAALLLCVRVLTTMTMTMTKLFSVCSVQMVLACSDGRLLLVLLMLLLLPMMRMPAAYCLWSASCCLMVVARCLAPDVCCYLRADWVVLTSVLAGNTAD
jgi:hypothetical protein